MAQHYVEAGRLSVKAACLAFGISQTCYRYEAYIFFRRRFSSSSSFMRAISEASMPPN